MKPKENDKERKGAEREVSINIHGLHGYYFRRSRQFDELRTHIAHIGVLTSGGEAVCKLAMFLFSQTRDFSHPMCEDFCCTLNLPQFHNFKVRTVMTSTMIYEVMLTNGLLSWVTVIEPAI